MKTTEGKHNLLRQEVKLYETSRDYFDKAERFIAEGKISEGGGYLVSSIEMLIKVIEVQYNDLNEVVKSARIQLALWELEQYMDETEMKIQENEKDFRHNKKLLKKKKEIIERLEEDAEELQQDMEDLKAEKELFESLGKTVHDEIDEMAECEHFIEENLNWQKEAEKDKAHLNERIEKLRATEKDLKRLLLEECHKFIEENIEEQGNVDEEKAKLKKKIDDALAKRGNLTKFLY